MDNIRDKILVLELHYLPSIAYLSAINSCKSVLIEQHEHYNKRSYRNRAHIAGANGLLRLSIPLKKGKNEQMPIKNVEITFDENWPIKHWRAITSAYQRAPYFEFYADDLEALLVQKKQNLFDWNLSFLRVLMDLFGIDKKIRFTESYQFTYEEEFLDLRNSISPKKNLQLPLQVYKEKAYTQLFQEKHGFIPNLSCLDLLFCTGPEAILYLSS